MPERIPKTQSIKISDVKAQLSSLVNEIYRGERRVLIEKAGIPVAVMISIKDFAQLDRLERQRQERFEVFGQMQQAFDDVPSDQIERDVVAIVREMRDEREAARRTAAQELADRRPA